MTKIALHNTQTTRIYRRRTGNIEITALLDGYVELSNAVWQGAGEADIDAALTAAFLPKGGLRNGITSFMINTGERVMMVDAGAAGLFGPHSSAFPDNLAGTGVAPERIDAVLVTHLHPDHIGALLKDGKATLPNAVLKVNEVELNFWTSAADRSRTAEFMRGWFDLIAALTAAYDGRIETFKAGTNLGDGITTIAQPGHTPGHTAFLLEDGGERLLFWGDLAVSHAIQFQHPAAHMIFDIDAATGHQSRLKGFDRAATERLLACGTHLPYPAFGYVERRGGAYAWVPESWRYDVTEGPLVPVI